MVFGFFIRLAAPMLWSGIVSHPFGSASFWAAVGLTALLAVFITPFVLGGLYFAWMALMGLCGRWEIDLCDGMVRVRVIAGPARWTWSRRAAEVTGVRLAERRGGRGGSTHTVVELAGTRPLEISLLMSDQHERWLAGAISHLVLAEPALRPEVAAITDRCPACGAALRAEDVDAAADVARCAACGSRCGLVALVGGEEELPGEPTGATPKGCRVDGDGAVVTVTASMASFKTVLGALLVNGFWNGIVSIFAGTGYGALYVHLVGPLPWWYPWANFAVGPKSGLKHTANTMPLSGAIELCVFMIPFMLIGSLLFTMLVLTVIGRVRVRLRGSEGEAFRGIIFFGHGLGFRKRFDAAAVQAVKVAGGDSGEVVIVEKEAIKFGGLLPKARAVWMAGVLRGFLVTPPPSPMPLLPGP